MTFLFAYMLTGLFYLATAVIFKPDIQALEECHGNAAKSLYAVLMFSLFWLPAVIVVLFEKLWQS